jgi:Uncharacterized protein conserved in bacteria (DUF2188)
MSSGPSQRLHVGPDPYGHWHVHREGEERALSEHASATQAERAAKQHAVACDAYEIVVHDRYHRVHTVIVPRRGMYRSRT